MNPRLVVEFLIGLGLIIAIGFAFVQTQNLTNTEATLEAAQAAGTEVGQAATDQADLGTVAAEEAAQNLDSAQATATESAQESADTQSTLEAQGTEIAEEAADEATQAAGELESAQGTATSAAESAADSSTQAAEELENAQATATESAQEAADVQSTIEAQGTEVAASAALEATQAAGDFADVAATATAGAERAEGIATQAANDLAVIEEFSATQGAELDAASASSDSLQATIDANVDLSGEGVFGESADLPEGYIRVRGEGFELGLPERFDGAELQGNTFSFLTLLNSLGLNETSAYLQAQGEQLIFFGIDTDLVDGVPAATVSVIREEPLTSELPLQEYIEIAYDPLPVGYSLVARDLVSVNGRPAGRVILNGQLIRGDVFVIQYVFAVEGDFWIVTFSGPASNFETLGPVIDESILTFRVR